MASSVCAEVISSMVVSTSTDAVIWSTLWTSLDNHSGLSRVAPNCESPPSDRPGSPLPSWKTQHIKTLHHYMSCRQFHLSNNVWSFALFAPNKTLPLTNSAKLLYSNCVFQPTCHAEVSACQQPGHRAPWSDDAWRVAHQKKYHITLYIIAIPYIYIYIHIIYHIHIYTYTYNVYMYVYIYICVHNYYIHAYTYIYISYHIHIYIYTQYII